jgi:Domain of unknown function (DUF4157)
MERADERVREPPARQAVAPPAVARLAPVARLSRRIGNQALMRALARMGDGDGILPDGTVHPEVEAAIAASRGRGSALPPSLAGRFARGLGASVDDVRVHTDARADALARSVSARAFATGTDVHFARGEYRPDTPAGDALIAHEVAHTEQQRGAPAAGPMAVSNPGDAMELEADAVARDLLA